ncbi:MAG: ComF family protein [Candidatus Omnitrophica bacterium]|nr:ComF family protein [Candidatus Omnitrophota bacterium]
MRVIILGMAIASLIKNFVNLIYPLHCASCKKPLDPENDSAICGHCIGLIKPNPSPYCIYCGRSVDTAGCACDDCLKNKPAFSKAYSACLYEGALKELILQFKYGGKLTLSDGLSCLISDFLYNNPDILEGIDMVTFVPIGADRMIKRGFNQSKILAKHLSDSYGIPMVDCIEKTASTKNQNELSRQDRLSNLKGAFRAKSVVNLTGLTILIVDDVMTTGATLNECAIALSRAGAARVRCLTLARGL